MRVTLTEAEQKRFFPRGPCGEEFMSEARLECPLGHLFQAWLSFENEGAVLADSEAVVCRECGKEAFFERELRTLLFHLTEEEKQALEAAAKRCDLTEGEAVRLAILEWTQKRGA